MSSFAQKPRRSAPSLERLEDRWCPSATLGLSDDGHTLFIRGDRGDNRIAVVQDNRGIEVMADGARPQTFVGVERILVDAGDGNDAVSSTVVGDGASDFEVADFNVRLGAGNDSFVSDVTFPPDPYRVALDAGAGDDAVTFRAVADPHGPAEAYVEPWGDFAADLGAGNDRFSAEIVYRAAVMHDPNSDRPTSGVRVAVLGGAGDDFASLRAVADPHLGAVADPHLGTVADPHPVLDFSADLGAGNDQVMAGLGGLTTDGYVKFDLSGGAGSDRMAVLFDHVVVNGGLDVNVDGGAGADVIQLVAGSRDAVDRAFDPVLIAASEVRIRLSGGGGSDFVIGTITPCILPQGSLDLTFDGGEGADTFDLALTLEPREDEAETDGPVRLTVLGGAGDDQLVLRVNNLDNAVSPLDVELDGGAGRDVAVVSPGIAVGGWNNHNQTFLLAAR